MNISKIFGWALLIIGLAIIFWILFYSYNIFTAKSDLPEFFIMETETTAPEKTGNLLSPEEMQMEMERIVGEQFKEIFPPNIIFDLLNLIVWSILACLLIFGGSQISGIGIKLIKVQEKRSDSSFN